MYDNPRTTKTRVEKALERASNPTRELGGIQTFEATKRQLDHDHSTSSENR